ncbi:MAG: cupin domain-containing protein [Acidobacteria bacterium]|nr:cupin domain-containing protein [Acidobacteriota bacterium]
MSTLKPSSRSLRARRLVTLRQLGRRVEQARIGRQMSLEQLSRRAGVSRSMISAIEGGSKAATVVILDRIATGLDSSLSRLLDPETQARVILLRHHRQKVARARAGWERRILSPVLPGVEFEFMRTRIAPGVDAGTFLPHAPGSREYLAVEKGTLILTLDGDTRVLESGDSIYYDGDCRHGFRNPGNIDCVYYLAMDVSGDQNGAVHRTAKGEPTNPELKTLSRRLIANGRNRQRAETERWEKS